MYLFTMNTNSPSTRERPRTRRMLLALAICVAPLLVSGCQAICTPPQPNMGDTARWSSPDIPCELNKVVLPPYVIEPPDVLSIDAINMVPKSPYHFRTSDKLAIQVENALPEAPIPPPGPAFFYPIQPGGIVQLGVPYGTVKIVGLTTDEARVAIETHLKEYLRNPRVTLALVEMAGRQQIFGEHMVAPDGTVTLGSYGSVNVVGKTVAGAKAAIEEHLSKYLENPEISVEVFGYNSKLYYVVTQGLDTGAGDRVTRFPVKGGETVLDAISEMTGLSPTSSTQIWVARPGHNQTNCDQILPVDWYGISQRGDVRTNYQVLPGDRIFVAEDKWIAVNQTLAKITAPFEKLMGVSILASSAVRSFTPVVLWGGGTTN